jgi:CheY-like chemotaxis protein
VLLVEDHEDTREVFTYVLEECGCEVVHALTALEVAEQARAFVPQVVFISVHYLDPKGIAFADHLRAISETKGCLIVGHSSYFSADMQLEMKTAGFDEIMLKPMPFTALLEILERTRLKDSLMQ